MNKKLSEIICHDNFNILCRVNALMQDIIYLKNENRSISQRTNNLRKKHIDYIRTIIENKGNKAILREYDKKIDSNVNLELLLSKLQKHNSNIIKKHRAKIQELRKGLVCT